MQASKFGLPPGPEFEVHPTPEQVEFFRSEGYLVVQRLTTDEEIAWLKQIFEYVFSPDCDQPGLAPVDRSGTLQPGEPSRLSQAFFPEIAFPELLQTNHWRNAKRFAAALLDVDPDELSSWGHMIRKPPGGRAALWHQDHAYWQPELDFHALGVWLPMHDVSIEMGAMQFIPRSHKRGLLRHRHDDAPEHNVLVVDEPIDVSQAVACPLESGGATFHHSETLHYTAPNVTDQVRMAFPMEFQRFPVPRAEPLDMPWTEQFRAATGDRGALRVVADGRVFEL